MQLAGEASGGTGTGPQAIPLPRVNDATDCRIKTATTTEHCRNRPPAAAAGLATSGRVEESVRLALFEPDIPQNSGALLRLAACFAVAVDLIEPLGFVLDDRRLRRAALDYQALSTVRRHASWGAFVAARDGASRLVLLTTKGSTPLDAFAFRSDDTLLLGRESAGVPDFVHAAAGARVVIPLARGARSLNVAQTGAIALYDALRQTGGLPIATGARPIPSDAAGP